MAEQLAQTVAEFATDGIDISGETIVGRCWFSLGYARGNRSLADLGKVIFYVESIEAFLFTSSRGPHIAAHMRKGHAGAAIVNPWRVG